MKCEQSSRFWIYIAMSISYNNNHTVVLTQLQLRIPILFYQRSDLPCLSCNTHFVVEMQKETFLTKLFAIYKNFQNHKMLNTKSFTFQASPYYNKNNYRIVEQANYIPTESPPPPEYLIIKFLEFDNTQYLKHKSNENISCIMRLFMPQ